jgi:hypothetical protein
LAALRHLTFRYSFESPSAGELLQPLSQLTQLTSLACTSTHGVASGNGQASLLFQSCLAALTQLRALDVVDTLAATDLARFSSLTRLVVPVNVSQLQQLPSSLQELHFRCRSGKVFDIVRPNVVQSLTAANNPSLQRITCFGDVGSEAPLPLPFNVGAGPVTFLQQSLVLRLCTSLRLQAIGADPLGQGTTAMASLSTYWQPGGQASPPVMELVLDRMLCPRGVMARLPPRLTHLHLEHCVLEPDSLVPVAQNLPRLRVLGLDANVSADALAQLLATAVQQGALTVHVWMMSPRGFAAVPEEVLGAGAAAAVSGGPPRTPTLVWHAWSAEGSAQPRDRAYAVSRSRAAHDYRLGLEEE